MRVRRTGFADLTSGGPGCDGDWFRGPGDATHQVEKFDWTLNVETDPNEPAWQLPASRWTPLPLARLTSDERREEFTRQCTYCHQQGNWATRAVRSKEDWEKIFKLMARMGGIISPELRAELPDAFHAAYDEKSYVPRLTRPFVPDTPFPGPRRLRFDSQGNLWIPGFSAGLVARFDTRTREFETWKLPIDGIETPYALNVDRRTDTVRICGTSSDNLPSFDPKSEQFPVYPLPTRVTCTREIDFDAEGNVWPSNSSFPTWRIAGPGPKIIRLRPG